MKLRRSTKLVVVAVILLMTAAVTWLVVSARSHPGNQGNQSGSLAITQWSVMIPLGSGTRDAYYVYDASKDQIYLTTTQLEQKRQQFKGCSSGLHGVYYKKVDKHLVEQAQIEILCAPLANDSTDRIQTIQKELRSAAKSAVW